MNSESLITKTALETIRIETEALQALVHSINADFVKTVETISCCTGRVILTGVGKSALVAQKIVATLNSTGTPALFLHAADAIHGDLGMILTDDIVICLSKSGETSEIKVLVPILKNLGNLLVAMVSNTQSYLAKHAQFVLHTPVQQEADPNNLAPTASTTAQIALGDALATALLALKGFTPKDFAQFHPGGSLGKQLYLRVKDLYPMNEAPQVLADANLRSTILEMTSKRLGATAVVDQNHKIIGIITDGDLRRMLERTPDTSAIKAQDLMSPSPKTIEPMEMALNALNMMREYSITQLIVCEADGTYLGFLHLHDLIREGLV